MTHHEHRGLNDRGYVVSGCRACEGYDLSLGNLLRAIPVALVLLVALGAFCVLLFTLAPVGPPG